MAFIKTGDREGCFRPEAVTHFTVHSTVEVSLRHKTVVTFVKMFAGSAQIAQYSWEGDRTLSHQLIGQILKDAEQSSDAVLSFDDLVDEQLKTPQVFL